MSPLAAPNPPHPLVYSWFQKDTAMYVTYEKYASFLTRQNVQTFLQLKNTFQLQVNRMNRYNMYHAMVISLPPKSWDLLPGTFSSFELICWAAEEVMQTVYMSRAFIVKGRLLHVCRCHFIVVYMFIKHQSQCGLCHYATTIQCAMNKQKYCLFSFHLNTL